MRHRIAVGLAIALLVAAAPARAALVDIFISHVTGGNDLRVDSLSPTGIGAVSLALSDSLGAFTPAFPLPPDVCIFASCGTPPGLPPGFHELSLEGTPLFGGPPFVDTLVPPFGSRVLGTFNSTVTSPDLVQVLPDYSALYDVNGLPLLDFAIHVVPEPGLGALLLLSLGASVLWKRRVTLPHTAAR
jgi:hypothetical protein